MVSSSPISGRSSEGSLYDEKVSSGNLSIDNPISLKMMTESGIRVESPHIRYGTQSSQKAKSVIAHSGEMATALHNSMFSGETSLAIDTRGSMG